MKNPFGGPPGNPNAVQGTRFHRHCGALGRNKNRTKGESPTGYRSRGPSADRQVRKMARKAVQVSKAERRDRVKWYDQ